MIIIESKTYLLKKERGRGTEFGSRYTYFDCLMHFWLFCLQFSVLERQRVGVCDQIRELSFKEKDLQLSLSREVTTDNAECIYCSVYLNVSIFNVTQNLKYGF